VPDIDELRKREEENSMGVWERYIVKTTEVEKTKAKILKADVAIRKAKQEVTQEKTLIIKANIMSNRKERQEKALEINDKFEKMDLKIEQASQRKMMYSVKHREIENLRFRDFEELREHK
jgi:hypothetical protein